MQVALAKARRLAPRCNTKHLDLMHAGLHCHAGRMAAQKSAAAAEFAQPLSWLSVYAELCCKTLNMCQCDCSYQETMQQSAFVKLL